MEIFKSVKWKLAIMCALCVTSILAVICTVQLTAQVYREKQGFEDAIHEVFSDEYITELSKIAEEVDYTVNNSGEDLTVEADFPDNAKKLYNAVFSHSGEIGLNRSRFMCVLDSSGTPVYCTDSTLTENDIEKTSTVTAALNGNISLSTSLMRKYMDYALALSTTEYIIYVKDTGDDIYSNLQSTLILYLECLLGALIISFLAGLYVAGSVTIPLKRLNNWAKQLADGNLKAKTDIIGHDELSDLADSLVHMANNIAATSTEAKNEKMKIETILQSMTDGLLAFNTEGKLIHANNEAKLLLNRNYLDDIDFDKFFKEINADITIGDLLYMEHENGIERHITIDKEKFILMSFQTFMLDNKVAGIVVVLHDTTKQEKLELSRRAFVADVSHELRTPITTVKSYAETLIDSCTDESDFQARFLRVIAAEADRMARLISDLLTLSALDDKHTAYKLPEEIDIRKMVEAVTERMQINASKKNQQLIYNPINDVPVITGDPDALERVIINIISNAIKYTPNDGEINIYTSKVYTDICIKITDNGMGIPEENLPHIFDRFYRVDKARARDTGGTGLGLAIAKQTIETGFKGKIKISSEVGKGTEVSITIPVPSN